MYNVYGDSMKKSGFIKLFLILFISLFFVEILFKFIAFKVVISFSMVRITIFSLMTSLFLSIMLSFFNNRMIKILLILLTFIFGLYPFLQVGFHTLMGTYMSFNAAFDGAGRITEFVFIFLKNTKFISYLFFLPTMILIFLIKFKKINFEIKNSKVEKLLICLITIFFYIIGIISLEVTPKAQIINNHSLYKNPTLITISLNQFGSLTYMRRDIANLFFKKESEFDIIIEDKEDEIETDLSRKIDDSEWLKLKDNEKNSKIHLLHEYYLSKEVTSKNDQTGIFKDKNLILIMVEAMDYLAIKEGITPTLAKLKDEGWFFDNYYAPKFSCTTGESEYIALTSIIPAIQVCTPNSYTNNDYSTSIFNLFNKKNYYSTSYHNWTDQFYNRTTLHKNMGSLNFFNHDELKIKSIGGWPSDYEMMEKALPYFIGKDKFFSFMITSSMHFPYDSFTGVVKRNWDVVKDLNYPNPVKYYLAKAVEFDKSLKLLIDTLEEKNKLEDTVIVLFADHHPFNMNLEYIRKYSSIDRKENLNIDKSPFIIYNKGQNAKVISKTASTFDILPTLANLFDLDYDPRYYFGKDVFSQDETTVVFTNGSWITDKAMYFANKGRHYVLDDSIDNNYLERKNKFVRDNIIIAENTLKYDYFKYRFKK